MRQSLGLVEIQGLAAAVVAADAMVKAANITLLGLERANGMGYHTIKVTGDVGAVNAAVNVGKQIGIDHGKLVSYKVIARPSDGVDTFFCLPPVKEADIKNIETDSKLEEKPDEVKANEKSEPDTERKEPEEIKADDSFQKDDIEKPQNASGNRRGKRTRKTAEPAKENNEEENNKEENNK